LAELDPKVLDRVSKSIAQLVINPIQQLQEGFVTRHRLHFKFLQYSKCHQCFPPSLASFTLQSAKEFPLS